jgi:hypothetical protein
MALKKSASMKQDESVNRTKSRIVEAAVEPFSRRGFKATTTKGLKQASAACG